MLTAPSHELWRISVEAYNTTCITIVWSNRYKASSYSIDYGLVGGEPPGDPLPQNGDDSSVFLRREICGLLPGRLYHFQVNVTGTSDDPFEVNARTSKS